MQSSCAMCSIGIVLVTCIGCCLQTAWFTRSSSVLPESWLKLPTFPNIIYRAQSFSECGSLSLFRWDEERGVGTKRCSLFSLRSWTLFKIFVTILTIYNYQIQNFWDLIKNACLYGYVDVHTFSQIVIWSWVISFFTPFARALCYRW